MDSKAIENKLRTKENNTSNNGEEEGGKQDMISNLPDDILSHILSLLPTEDAEATRPLSKKWNRLFWKSRIDLRLDDRDCFFYSTRLSRAIDRRKEFFVRYVSRVLQFTSSPIRSFTLGLTDTYDPLSVNSWISILLSRNIQKLSIKCRSSYLHRYVNFESLFRSNSLAELELAVVYPSIVVSGNLGSFEMSQLSNLRSLKMSGLSIVGDSEELVLSFPALEVFTMKNCKWLTIRTLVLKTPLLETLSIDHSAFVQRSNNAIKMSAPLLKNFTYNGDLCDGIIFSHPLSGVNIVFDMHQEQEGTLVWLDRAHMLLEQLHNSVVTLRLGHQAIMVMSCWAYYDELYLPTFHRLLSLVFNSRITNSSQKTFFILLHKSPILQTLEFFGDIKNFDKDVWTSEIPQCLISTLKIVKFKINPTYKGDINVAEYILKNARVLEEMNISFLRMGNEGQVKRVKQQLLSSQKSSRILSLKFVDN